MADNKIIQFLHPGGEPTSHGGQKWNTGAHKRKFLSHSGVYLEKSKRKKGQIHFWGEWEAESTFKEILSNNKKRGIPQNIFYPKYTQGEMPKNAINTDPFVFGDFIYSVCHKFKDGKETQLYNKLKSGDIILFGSNLNSNFVLDTVFVVADSIEVSKADYEDKLKNRVSRTYFDVVLKPIFKKNCEPGCNDKIKKLNIHFGATFEKPFNQMYSFVPCLPATLGSEVFPRPNINLEGISPNLNTNFRVILLKNNTNIKKEWETILNKVIEERLKVAIAVDPVFGE